jgi:AcrR family transcriptional regulator
MHFNMKENKFPRASETTQQRRDHIIQAATRVIAEEGLPALSVRSVANRAGCSRGLVEHYFRNKTALLVASNDWANDVYLERVDAAVGAMTGLEALDLRLRNLIPYNETIHNEWKVRIAFWHQGITIPSVEESNNRSFYSVYNAILADMRQAQASGEIATTIPLVVTSELLLMTVIGLCVCTMNDAKLRKKAPLDRRLAMITGFLKTGDVAALAVGDPETDY